MSEIPELFDELKLRAALTCALLMAAIDGQFDPSERGVCLQFLNKHWRKEYGNAKDFFLDTVKEVKPYLTSKHKTQAMIESLAESLNYQQKQTIIDLVQKVMLADQQVLVSEMELMARFKKIQPADF